MHPQRLLIVIDSSNVQATSQGIQLAWRKKAYSGQCVKARTDQSLQSSVLCKAQVWSNWSQWTVDHTQMIPKAASQAATQPCTQKLCNQHRMAGFCKVIRVVCQSCAIFSEHANPGLKFTWKRPLQTRILPVGLAVEIEPFRLVYPQIHPCRSLLLLVSAIETLSPSWQLYKEQSFIGHVCWSFSPWPGRPTFHSIIKFWLQDLHMAVFRGIRSLAANWSWRDCFRSVALWVMIPRKCDALDLSERR